MPPAEGMAEASWGEQSTLAYCCLEQTVDGKKNGKGTDKSKKTTETYLSDARSNDPIVCASDQEFVQDTGRSTISYIMVSKILPT